MKVRTEKQQNFDREVGLRLAKVRIKIKDLSQKRVSELLERTESFMCHAENGIYGLNFYNAVRLARIYNISLDELVKGLEVEVLDI